MDAKNDFFSLKTSAATAIIDHTLQADTRLLDKHLDESLIKRRNPELFTFKNWPFSKNFEIGFLLAKSIAYHEVQKIKIRYLGTLERTLPSLDNPKRGLKFYKNIQVGPGRLARCKLKIKSLFEQNTSEVSVKISDAIIHYEEILALIEDIFRRNNLQLVFQDARMYFYYQRSNEYIFGTMLEFIPTWIYEDNLETYLKMCYTTINANILNDVETCGSNASRIWKISQVAYCDVQRWFVCPCGFSKESHDAWLSNGFCVTHLDGFL